jgi:hypothetical protein
MKLYIRFFDDRDQMVPGNAWVVSEDDNLISEINQWLKDHPDGKVDFVLM